MADVAGLLASAVITHVGAKLGSAIEEQVSMLCSFKNDMKDMKEMLESMEAALKDAERRSIREETVRLWLKRLKNTALDMSDIIDEYQADSKPIDGKMSEMFSCLPIAPKTIILVNKIKKTRENLRKIHEQHQSFNFAQNGSSSTHQVNYDQRETSSDVDETRIIGRNEEKQEIIHLLCASGSKRETTIIPIYGLGGMGKTTLAGLVYNDSQVIKKYDHRIWVFVSEVFDLKKIGSSIISQMSIGRQQNADTLQSINICLDDLFRGKKILIILDDIWEDKEEELDKLKSMLNVGKQGNMIDVIVTTRKEDVAKKICTSGPYNLQPLQDDMCWNIIKTYSQFEYKSNKEQLEKIGLDIAKKCGGVALAAKALGYMLKSKDLTGWSDVHNTDIWNESSEDDSSPHEAVLLSLKLSYERMPSQQRLCFSYCAIFTRGHDIIEDDLIHHWIALGFVNTSSKGKEYMKQLLGISFLQYSRLPSVSGEQAVRYTMHDLLHDLARSVNGDELIVIDAAKKSNTSKQKFCRYASLINYEGQTKLSNILPHKVRAVHFFLDSSRLDLPVRAFSFAKCLRVLDFSECSSILFPASIGKLKQLRCLIAPRMQNEKLPDCITELSKLQYLNLRGSSLISILPGSIGKLRDLTYLDLSGCSGISELPESFGDLKSMVHLHMLGCSGIRELPGSLGNLTCLQHLELSKCSNVKAIPESLCNIIKLQYLNLSNCDSLGRLPEDIGSLINLQYLNISYCWQIRELPESFKKLRNLLHLDLVKSRIEKGLPEAIRCLTALQHLDMSHNFWADLNKDDLPDVMRGLNNLKYLNLSNSMNALFSSANKKSDKYFDFIGTLTNLEHLNLSLNGELISLPGSIGNLNKLHTLDLSCCTELKSVPDSIGTLSLKSLLIEGCSDELIDQANSRLYSPTLPLFKVRVDDASDCSNLHLVGGLNMAELRIFSLENVRYLEEARKLKLLDKQNLSDLTLAWTLDAGRFLEDNDLLGELVPPTGLKHFCLRGYISTSFPSWLTSISHYLPNLVSISLCALPTSCNLPPLGQLPNLERLLLHYCPSITKINRDFCGGKGAFRRLSRVQIQVMEGLEEWNTTYCVEDGVEEFMFPMLDYLCVLDCPRLRLEPYPPAFRECLIGCSNQVLSSLEEVRSIGHLTPSTASTTLWIRGNSCQSLRLFHHFPALQQLEISDCPNLTSLPDSMRHLTSLQSLVLLRCESIAAMPEWLPEISCLRNLKIVGCVRIKSLPPSIQHLTKLQKLKIEKNQQLIQWCESEENRTKLAHIKDTVYQHCD